MQKNYFHNGKLTTGNIDAIPPQVKQEQYQRVVDINKLLNRVKINAKNEKKKKFFSLSLISLAMIIFTAIFLS